MLISMFRWLIYLMGSWSIILLALVVIAGIFAKKDNQRPLIVDTHRSIVDGKYGLINTTIAIVFTVLVFLWFLPPLDRTLWYVKLHLYICVPIFTIALVLIKTRFSGSQSKLFHKFVAYPCAISGLLANVLGIYIAHNIHN